jgi:hypothetical protein
LVLAMLTANIPEPFNLYYEYPQKLLQSGSVPDISKF